MAVTGLLLVGFLLMHMYGNLKVFLGAEAFDHYAHWLKGSNGVEGLLYPLIPNGWFIWIFRAVMLAAIVAHMYSAWVLTQRAHRARSTKYVNASRGQATYASRTMRWGGVILALFLVFHLLQFTAQAVTTGFKPGASPYESVVGSFQIWWVVLAYAIWVAIVCMHVRHGVWSALTTLGANTSPKARSVLNSLAWIIAVLLYVGFMIMPLAVLFGMVK